MSELGVRVVFNYTASQIYEGIISCPPLVVIIVAAVVVVAHPGRA